MNRTQVDSALGFERPRAMEAELQPFGYGLWQALIVLILILISSEAFAQSAGVRFWNGADNSNWRNDQNWVGGDSPTRDHQVIMLDGISRNNINLASNGDIDSDREVYAIRFRTSGDGTTVPDYFGANQDLFANWRFRRGRLLIPSNSAFPDTNQILSWVDTRVNANEMTIVADLELPSGTIFFTAEGEGGHSSGAGTTDSTEILNVFGNISGSATIDLRSSVFESSSPYRSRLVLHEANDFSGKVLTRSGADLYLRDPSALANAEVELLADSVFDTSGLTMVNLDALVNGSEVHVPSDQLLIFGSRAAQVHDGVFTGSGVIAYEGTHEMTLNGFNSFSGQLIASGPVRLGSRSALAQGEFFAQSDNVLDLVVSPSFVGGLSGPGDLVIDRTLAFASSFDLVYDGDLTGSGSIQQSGTDWTYNGNSSIPFEIFEGVLSGTGSMASTEVTTKGVITPGASEDLGRTGVQQFDSLVLGGTYRVDVNDSSDHDQIQISGALDLTGSTLDYQGTTSLEDPVIIATYGSLTGTFATVNFLPADVDVRYSWNDAVLGTNNIALVPNITPSASDDSYQTDQDGVLNGLNVLDNDSDGDFDALTVVSSGQFSAGGIGGLVDLFPSGEFEYVPPAAAVGQATFSYTVEDNNGAQATATVTIQVNNVEPQAVNDAYGINEDGTLSSANVLSNDMDSFFEVLSVINAGSQTAGGIGGTITLASDGSLTYTPPTDAFGTATLIYEIEDSVGATDTAMIEITVAAVNDAPSFVAADPAPVVLGSGAQEITDWATFDPGPLNESGQSVLAYTVNNISDPTLFDESPTVDPNGVLRYTPNLTSTGTSTFDVHVQDDGGTANGGEDTSQVQTYTISVRSPGLFSDRFEQTPD